MESSGTGAEDHSNSGPSPGRNPFDLANILRSSPFTGSLSSTAAIYPPLSHMPSAFSMLDPHPVFPGAALFPFGGLGPLGEGLMSAGVLGHSLGPVGNGGDWWRAASEQTSRQATTDSVGPGAFYAGLNGTFGSPLFSPMFSSGISNASGATSSDNLSVNKSSSISISGSKSLSSKSHRQSLSSSPIPKDSKESFGRKDQRFDSDRCVTGNQETSSHVSSARSGRKGGTVSDRSPEAMLKNSSAQLDYSLENSLLSAEAALYSASPFFFPFSAMAALSSAFGGLPFPGSSGMYSCPTASMAYTSPFTMFPSHSSTSTSKMSTAESPVSQKSKSESRTWTPVSRMSSAGTTSSTPGANTPKPNTPVSPGTPYRNRSMAISPCELGRRPGGDHKKDSLGTATSVIVSRGSSTPSTGSSARTLSISDHKMHLSGKIESQESDERSRGHISSPQKMVESKLRMMSTPDSLSSCGSKPNRSNDRHNSTSGSEMFNDSSLYSLDGAIDLSIKKPRTESPARVAATLTKSNTASKSSDYRHNSSIVGSLVSSSQADVLSALAHSHQMYAEHQAQLLANNQMAAAAAAAGLTDPLSFNLAAAALLPQMYDGMTGLFYPPSALAAMAAASGVMSNASPSEKVKSGRGRGRRRVVSGPQQQQQSSSSRNRGRGSSHFISSMMQMTKKPEESPEKKCGHGTGAAESGSGSKSGSKSGKSQVLSASTSFFDAEERNRQELVRQQMESEMQQQQHHHQLKLLQKMHQKKDESSVSGTPSECGSRGGHGSARGNQNRKETLTSKLQHHQSKLAKALMGQDGLMTPSSALLLSPLFKKGSNASEHQLTSTEYDSSVRTDSDVESSSSVNSGSQVASDGESHTTQGSEGGMSTQSTSGSKRKEEEEEGGPERKRRRVVVDEMAVRIPLEQHGWQRETRIHSCTSKKLIGDVVYIAPCGKMLHNSYELEKYLEQVEIKDLNQENFTFSTKINMGKFFVPSTGEQQEYSQLSDAEVQERFAAIETRKRRILEKRIRAELREECLSQTEEPSDKLTETQLQKKCEQLELAKRVADMKLKKRAEQQQQKEFLHRARQLQVLEMKKSKEKQKVTKQQEKINRQQQMKIENEARNQQINEEKEAKRQQSLLKEQERERRRQQVLLVKAMEARKREDEKERVKEEKKSAKKLDREKKLEQKRQELFLAREQKKPMEDMCITDGKSLPELERIHGVKLSGRAFADCLMVLEFAHNFVSSLGFDNDSLPTMKILQGGLLNDDSCLDEFMSFVSHLVRFVLEDPGMSNPKEAVSQSGQKLNDIEITNDNISEIMRIFIRSRNGKVDEMTDWLKTKPFQSLNPTQKAAILAYLCNELLSSKSITGEIEKNIEGINNLRRDKWVIEGKVRKLRIMQAKHFRKVIPKGQLNEDSNTLTTAVTPANNKKGTDEEGEESGNDSDEAPSHADGAHDSDPEEDQSISSEELEGKIEKLLKQQNQLREKVLSVAHKLSAVSFGQDRYRRRYWVLPKCGGIFIEGLESAEPEIFEAMKGREEPVLANGQEPVALCQELMQTNDEAERLELNASAESEERESTTDATCTVADSVPTSFVEEAKLKAKDEQLEIPSVTSECPTENGQGTSLRTSFVAAVSVTNVVSSATVSVASVPVPTYTATEEKKHFSTLTNCCLGRQPDFMIQSLSDIVSQTVMNTLVHNIGPEDMSVTPDSEHLLAQSKAEVKIKEETEPQPEAANLYDDKFKLKLEPNQFKLDGYESGEKPVIKSEIKDMVKGVVDVCTDYIQTNACAVLEMEKSLMGENSCQVPAVAKSDTDEAISTEQPRAETDSIANFSSLYSNLLSCAVSSATSSTLSTSTTASFSSFRSIDSILKPDLKIKPNNVFASPVSSCSTSTTSSYLVSSSACTAELARWNINRSILNGTWFSILPRVPCDASSLKPCPSLSQLPSVTNEVYGTGTPRPVVSCPSLCSTPGSTVTACLTPTPSKQEIFAEDLLLTPIELEMQAEYTTPHEDAPPIPSVYQRGWWKISNPEQIKQMLACLNLRGIRERNLQKTLEKYLDYVCISSTKAKKNVFKLEGIVDEEAKSAATAEGNDIVSTQAAFPDDEDDWNRELQQKMEVKVLEDIESMEERVCHASLQVKDRKSGGWKMSPRVTTDSSVELVSSYETDLKANQRYILESTRSRLLFLEHNIERRYLKPPLGRSTQLNLASITTSSSKDNVSSSDDDSDADEETATKELSSWRSAVASATSSAQLCLYMMQLNKCIAWEKSIMKVSCQICCCDDNEAELLLCDICDRGYHTYCVKPKIESIPEGDWYCYECISKASGDTCCVVCGRHGNKLATCEFCRRRAHIDCLDPPLARMPKKWSCNSCAVEKGKMKKKQSRTLSTASANSSTTSASVTSTPVKEVEKELNGNEKDAEPDEKLKLTEENKLQEEESQQTAPPTPSSEKSTKSSKAKNDRCRDKSDFKSKKIEDDEVMEKKALPVCNGDSNTAEDMPVNQPSLDMSICSTILTEMKKHQDAWPFLTPVSSKQFPTYRKVIRMPIDFKTMGRKLRNNAYKSLEEFAVDARLVFSNCELFNEDDSSVGRAGHSMKLFFEKRWSELTTKQ